MIQSIRLICAVMFILPVVVFAQDEPVVIDASKLPAEASEAKEFTAPGWTVEEAVSGDLDGDAKPDVALKLVHEKPAGAGDDVADMRERALVILLKGADGMLHRAAVAGTLLQCGGCGGAFYGVSDAPSNVSIEKGVLVVEQDHGSRNVTDETFRFRYEPATKRFALIGFDVADRDRATAEVVTESTNYLTGNRVSTHSKGKRDITSKSRVKEKTVYIEEVDYDKLTEAAEERLAK